MLDRAHWVGTILLTVIGRVVGAQEVPKDHRIYQRPKLVQDIAAVDLKEEVLKWSFSLEKERYRVGEVISGVLRVQNVSDRITALMTKPSNGFFVSTVGIWRAYFSDETGEWSDVEEVHGFNHGAEPTGGQLYQGRGFKLEPGGSAAVNLPINVYQGDPGSGGPMWLSGVGFAQPRKYAIYIRYFNLAWRVPRGGELTPLVGNEYYFPYEPVVLGPFVVEVEPVDDQNKELMQALDVVTQWERATRDRRKGVRTDRFEAIEANAAQRLLDEGSALLPAQVLRSFRLTLIRRQLNKKEMPVEQLQALGDEVWTGWRGLADGALKDGYGFTLMGILDALGDVEGARMLGKQVATPDAKIWIDTQKAVK